MPRTPASPGRDALLFTTVVLGSALLLQRFGVPAGGKAINVVGFVGLAAAAIGLARGSLVLDPTRLAAFIGLCLLTVLGMACNQIFPNRFQIAPSLQSLLQFLLLSSFATVSFAKPLPETVFFRRVADLLGIVAVAGLLQFAAQFVGLQLFSFKGFIPAALSFEDGYNLTIPTGFAGLFKSNGFFLLEPSIFSQLMAVALMVELLSLRRTRYLSLFLLAMLVSLSGTGWIVLASFVATVAFSLGIRGIVLAAGTVALLALFGAGVAVLAPDVGAAFGARMDEVSLIGTSGHLRFVTPFWLFGDVLRADPPAFLYGLGAGVSERLVMAYDYDVNTPVKIALEFGVPALLAYLVLLAGGRKTPAQRTLVAPGLVLLLFTGGYQQFPPMLFPIVLLISIARLDATVPARGPVAVRPEPVRLRRA